MNAHSNLKCGYLIYKRTCNENRGIFLCRNNKLFYTFGTYTFSQHSRFLTIYEVQYIKYGESLYSNHYAGLSHTFESKYITGTFVQNKFTFGWSVSQVKLNVETR